MKRLKPVFIMYLTLGICSLMGIEGCGNLRAFVCKSTQECTRLEVCSQGYCVPDQSTGDGGTQKDTKEVKKDEKNIPEPKEPECTLSDKKCNGLTEAFICKDGMWSTIRCASDEECKVGNCEKLSGCKDGQTRACGVHTQGECRKGIQTCRAGAWGSCVDEIKPSTEMCDGKDNNCNGQTDEGSSLCPSGQECKSAKCESVQTTNKPRIFVKSDGAVCIEMDSSERPKVVYVGGSVPPASKNPVFFTVSMGGNITCTPPKTVVRSSLLYFLFGTTTLWPHKTSICTKSWCKGLDLIWGFFPEGSVNLEGLKYFPDERDNQFLVTR